MDHWVCDLALHTKLNALRATPIAPCNSLFIAKWHSMGWTEDRLINHSPIFNIFSFWLLKLLWDFPVANSFHFSGTHIREGNGLVTCESESQSIVSNSLRPHGLYSPWKSTGQNTGVGTLSLLQGIFPIQGSNPGLQYCRQILYQLSYQGSLAPWKVHIYYF